MKISVNTPDLLADIHEKDAKYQNSLLCLFALGVIGFQTLTEQSGSDREDADSPIQRLEGMAARLENANLYQILSVSKEASPDEIQAAYHVLAKQFHPDRFQSETFSTDIHQKAQHVFASINEAYQTLKNPGSRAAYDANRGVLAERMESGSTTKTAMRLDNEKTAETLFQSGQSFLANGDYEKAIDHFKRCLWLRPENALYHHSMGVARSKNPKSRKEAEQHLLKALELDAMLTESHMELAKLYLQAGLRRKTEQQLQQLLYWKPNHREALKLLADLGTVSK
jgi:curved DNA-binding protein CbpA